MNLTKSARYALYAAVEMARAGTAMVTVGQVASRYRIPEGALAKVFQQLVRAGLAFGTRGIGGGYRLARPAAEVTVLDVIAVFERPRAAGQCLLVDRCEASCEPSVDCNLRHLFDEVDELVRCTYASVTLETVARGPGTREAPRAAVAVRR